VGTLSWVEAAGAELARTLTFSKESRSAKKAVQQRKPFSKESR
jgi:hypothetical protein